MHTHRKNNIPVQFFGPFGQLSLEVGEWKSLRCESWW